MGAGRGGGGGGGAGIVYGRDENGVAELFVDG